MRTGWMCPRCRKVNAPWVAQCNCKVNNDPFKNLNIQKLKLTENDKIVINAMWKIGLLRQIDIVKRSGLRQSVVAQRLKYLELPEKGKWINRTGKHYEVDTSKKRYWI